MSLTELIQIIFMTVYTIMLVVVSLFGFHRYALVFLYWKHRHKKPELKDEFEELPAVTVQLPMFNERFVARRVIERTCQLDYPNDKLQIQVLDDSTDETRYVAEEVCKEYQAKGFNVEYIHRDDRTGYKAGALANGMKTAIGEFITIFDADFLPEPDFLKRTVHYFTDPKVCVVQSRWEHLNRNHNTLTECQAIFLDGHFAIEHVGRNRSGRFMSFNGTGGTWRRAAIDEAGGWRHDTLTEDLDLSYRAQLKGWKFIFLPDLVSPAELPPEISGFKAQQFRWTKGGAQNAMKLLPKVLLSNASLKVKIESFFHLTGFMLHLFMLGMVLLMFPALYLQCLPLDQGTVLRALADIGIFTLATMSASVFYCCGQTALREGGWRHCSKYLPFMMALGVGLCLSNTKAIIEAWFGKESGFVRTPKYGRDKEGESYLDNLVKPKKKSSVNWLAIGEFVLGIYMLCCLLCSIFSTRSVAAAPFLAIFAFGFFYVSVLSIMESRASESKSAAEPATETIK